MPADAARPSSAPLSPLSSHDHGSITPQPDKSLGAIVSEHELCGKVGDDGVRRAAYRGG
jgi:hypothetical protein